MSQIKTASFSMLKIKMSVLSVLWQIKGARFIFIVTDQNCQLSILSQFKIGQFYIKCHRSKLPAFQCWSKNVRFICFVADKKKCQSYLHFCRSKLPVLSSLSHMKIGQFYIKCHRSKLPAFHCWSWKMPVLSVLLQLKRNASLIFIVADQSCQFYLHCHR